MKLKQLLLLVFLVVVLGFTAGCTGGTTSIDTGSTTTANEETTPSEDNTTVDGDVESSSTDNTTTEEPTTEEPTTEAPTEPYVGAWTLLSTAKLAPTQSGYSELDTLVNDLLSKVVTDDMNGYKKAWACYEYLIDNITYSRGMEANTGMYSTSDPATTPTEVLWATDLLNSGMGCCYHYSAAYVYILRAIGFEAHLVSGNVPAYSGGVTPHCWLYVTIDGVNYIFDPDLDMNYYTREVRDGVENPVKDRFFCVKADKMTYFYQPETYYTN